VQDQLVIHEVTALSSPRESPWASPCWLIEVPSHLLTESFILERSIVMAGWVEASRILGMLGAESKDAVEPNSEGKYWYRRGRHDTPEPITRRLWRFARASAGVFVTVFVWLVILGIILAALITGSI